MGRPTDGLSPEARSEFDEWARRQRETNIAAMAESAIVMSIYPSGEFDIEYALQVGAMLLLEKPILLLVAPGQQIPAKLRAVADEIIEVSLDDVDTGSDLVRDQIKAFIKKHVPS